MNRRHLKTLTSRYCLINAVIGKVGPGTQVTGNPTYQELQTVSEELVINPLLTWSPESLVGRSAGSGGYWLDKAWQT